MEVTHYIHKDMNHQETDYNVDIEVKNGILNEQPDFELSNKN